MMQEKKPTRCPWSKDDPDYVRYHDEEWGVPCHDDRHLFEMLVLEGAQAGLSWLTILKKRPAYRHAFARFDVIQVASFDRLRIDKLMLDRGIVRNRLKLDSAVNNARCVLAVIGEFGTLDSYLWRFVGGRQIGNRWRTSREVPITTPESDAMSRDLRQRGFQFVGSTICYSLMQAVGMVNDHLITCHRHAAIRDMVGRGKVVERNEKSII